MEDGGRMTGEGRGTTEEGRWTRSAAVGNPGRPGLRLPPVEVGFVWVRFLDSEKAIPSS
jgi:hypothetical protein